MAAAFGALRRSPAEPAAEGVAIEKEKQSLAPSGWRRDAQNQTRDRYSSLS